MIKQSLFVTFICFVVYAAFIGQRNHEKITPLHDWEGNVIRAQNFLFETHDEQVDNVMVGSSLAYRIDQLPANYFNLSFAGLSIYDGMEILLASDKMPKKILIETNVIQRLGSEVFQEALLKNKTYQMKEKIPFFREKHKPVPIFINQIYTALYPVKPKTAKPIKLKETNQYALAEQAKNYAIPLSVEEQTEIETKLATYIKQFELRNVEVIFFELPVDKTLCDTPKSHSIKAIIDAFPDVKLIEQPDCSQYTTADGAHLQYASVLKYTDYLLAQLQ